MAEGNKTQALDDFGIHRLSFKHTEMLGEFFVALVAQGDDAKFHPHPLTREYAAKLATCETRDFYCVLTNGQIVIAYGMLRGWDEGYSIPSLGLAVHPKYRSAGYSRVMMGLLHACAKWCGARQVRLTVERSNLHAIALYESLGYQWSGHDDGPMIGHIQL